MMEWPSSMNEYPPEVPALIIKLISDYRPLGGELSLIVPTLQRGNGLDDDLTIEPQSGKTCIPTLERGNDQFLMIRFLQFHN